MTKRWLGIFQVLLAGISFGFLGIFGRWAFTAGFSVGELLFWRFLCASVFLWLGLLIFNPTLIWLKLSQILTSVCLGIFGYAVFSTLYFQAIQGISVALAAMLLFTFPIFVSLGSHFVLKEKMNGWQWVSLVVASLGLVLLLWGDLDVSSIKSLFMALLAAITYAIYVLVSGRLQKDVQPLSSSLYVVSSATLGLYIFHRPMLSRVLEFNINQIQIILGLAIICSIVPLTLFLAGLQKMRSAQASILVMIEPVVAAIAAWVLLGERLQANQVLGAAMIFVALLINALLK